MSHYEERSFNIPELKGISQTTIDEHLKLYAGYVKHTNYILDRIATLRQEEPEDNMFEIGELRRRLSFEFDGMRNHEYYFAALEGGPQELAEDSPLRTAIANQWGSFNAWQDEFKQMATTRGIGWANLAYDPKAEKLINYWNDEQHLGHLLDVRPVLMLDMWEHSFVADYLPSGKKDYVNDFFENVNWSVIEQNYQYATSL